MTLNNEKQSQIKNRYVLNALLVLCMIGSFFAYQQLQKKSDVSISIEEKSLLEYADVENIAAQVVKFDKMREVVNAHSRSANSEGSFLLNDTQIMNATTQIYRYAAGLLDKPPELTSAQRAYILKNLLEAQKYDVRVLTFLAKDKGIYQHHTALEVLNPRTERWELIDPDYNVFFSYKNSLQRIGAEEFLSLPAAQITPCAMDDYCSWETLSPEGKNIVDIKNHYQVIFIKEAQRSYFLTAQNLNAEEKNDFGDYLNGQGKVNLDYDFKNIGR